MLSFFLSNHLKVTTQKIVKSVHINFAFCVRITSLALPIITVHVFLYYNKQNTAIRTHTCVY